MVLSAVDEYAEFVRTSDSVAAIFGCILAGCAAPVDAPTRDLKEAYVEAPRGTVVVQLVPYPLSAKEEDRAYVAVRDFVGGRGEGQRKLTRLLIPDDAPLEPKPKTKTKTKPGEKPKVEEPKPIALAPHKTPSLLLFPEKISARRLSACYLGHSAYARRNYSPLVEVVHHLRVLIVNRETGPLRLDVRTLTLEPTPSGIPGEPAGKDSGITRLVATNAKGERLDSLQIPPEGDRLLHVFFTTRKQLPSLLVRWEVERAAAAAPGQRRVWTFSATLSRRYIVQNGVVSALERRVALGVPLPAASPEPGPWSEPRISPIGR